MKLIFFAFSNVTNDTDLGLDIFGTGCLSHSNSLTRYAETDPCYTRFIWGLAIGGLAQVFKRQLAIGATLT